MSSLEKVPIALPLGQFGSILIYNFSILIKSGVILIFSSLKHVGEATEIGRGCFLEIFNKTQSSFTQKGFSFYLITKTQITSIS
jgi:hypothetical protein